MSSVLEARTFATDHEQLVIPWVSEYIVYDRGFAIVHTARHMPLLLVIFVAWVSTESI